MTATTSRKFPKCLSGVGLDDKPLAIIAKTYKGAGVSFLQDKDGWHGKPLNKEEAAKAIAELQPSAKSGIGVAIPAPNPLPAPNNAAPASYPPLSLQNRRQGRHARSLRQRARCASAKWINALSRWTATRKIPPIADKFFKKFPDAFHGMLHRRAKPGRRGHGFWRARQSAVRLHVRDVFHPRLRPDPRRGHFAGEPQARRLARRRQHRRGRPVANGAGRSGDDARGCRQHRLVSERRRQHAKNCSNKWR